MIAFLSKRVYLLFLAFASAAAIGGNVQPERVVVSGTVQAQMRDLGGKGKVLDASFLMPDGQTCPLEMDEKGRSLIEVMNGQSVDVEGVFTDSGQGRKFRVRGYADKRMNAAHELWRRAGCNACAIIEASRDAALPADMEGALPMVGRDYSSKAGYLAWTTDARFLWLATDVTVEQVALDSGNVVKVVTKQDGLPDNRVYQLASDGETLWIAYRGGIASLDIGSGVITDRPALKSAFAKVRVDTNCAWIVADTLTCRIEKDGGKAATFPAIPTADRIRARVDKGVWTPQWARRTAHFVGDTLAVGDRLYACSYGALYELAGGKWTRIERSGFSPVFAAGRLWYACAEGIGEYRPETGRTEYHRPAGLGGGAPSGLALVGDALWMTADPAVKADGATAVGGGVARMDIGSGGWEAWTNINGGDASHVGCMTAGDGAVWVATAQGDYRAVPVQPGMMLATYGMFEPRAFALNRYDVEKKTWATLEVPRGELTNRLVCGQYGFHAQAPVRLHAADLLSAGSSRVFAVARLMPDGYCGGYWPTALQMAERDVAAGTWRTQVDHRPGEVNLEGEQPSVLNVSNGELVELGEHLREAVGHDNVLGMFLRGGRHWIVTEGCAAWFDDESGRWKKAVETGFRWYWRATAAADNGRELLIGSDRGLICRMDFRSGQFRTVAALQDRAIESIVLRPGGAVEAQGKDAPLGAMPDRLRMPAAVVAGEVAFFDGTAWVAATGMVQRTVSEKATWFFGPMNTTGGVRQVKGNLLCNAGRDGRLKARYYVKEVYQPRYLCSSPDNRRLWFSTFTGLLRVDLPESATEDGR